MVRVPGCALRSLLLAGFVLLANAVSHAQVTNINIAWARLEGTNLLVAVNAPAGSYWLTLESRPGFNHGDWIAVDTKQADLAGGAVTFRIPCVAAMELVRVRAGIAGIRDPDIVGLGDSLTDTGHHYLLYGHPGEPDYFTGRYSNGRVWLEYMSEFLGIPPGRMVNYALGGATSGRHNCCTPGAPGLLQQRDAYLADSAAAGGIKSNTLHVIWVGPNDFETWRQTEAFKTTPLDVLMGEALGNIKSVIETLADRGAKRFLVPNLPDLGRIPRTQASGDPAQIELASLGTMAFNLNLAWVLGELERTRNIDIIHYDVFSLYEAVRTNPGQFGFTNVTTACLSDLHAGISLSEDNYLFWDDRHPTTAGHRMLAEGALRAIQNGGMPLPSPCPTNQANGVTVRITTPSGKFTLADSIEIHGTVTGLSTSATLRVNGIATQPAAEGSFAVMVSLSTNNLENPVIAEVSAGQQVIARDRIVVYRGPSIRNGEIARDAVVATLNSNGVSAIRDELVHLLTESRRLDFWTKLPNPLMQGTKANAFLHCDAGYYATASSLTYSCATVDAEMHPGFIRLRFAVRDIALRYHADVWFSNCPDNGFDCDGMIYVPSVGIHMDFSVRPAVGGNPGEVDVQPLSSLELDHTIEPEHIIFDCDNDVMGLVTEELRNKTPEIRQKFQDTISDFLTTSNRNALVEVLERTLAKVSISSPLSNALGVAVEGDIQDITHREGQMDVRFIAGFSNATTLRAETYAPPVGTVDHTGLDPVAGQPYDFAVSVSLKTLNQLLLAESGRIPQRFEVTQFDFGTGNLPVSAGLLSLFFPALRAETPSTPYKLVARPTLPPMIVNGSSVACPGVEVAMDQVHLDIVRMSGGQETVVLAVVVDLRACVTLGYDRSRTARAIGLALSPDSLRNVVVLENRICADAAVVNRVLGMALSKLTAGLAGEPWYFQIPSLRGLEITPTRIVVQNGYVSVFVDLKPEHGRSDLTVAEINAPEAVDVNFPFTFRFRVKNVGHERAYGGAWFGASLSVDGIFMNGNDGGIGLRFFNFRGGSLGIGESEWFTFGADAAPWAFDGNQTMFVGVDVPQTFGGSGLFCESSEMNNLGSAPIRTTRADAYVALIDPPDGLLGGGPPGVYQVRIGRSDVGIDMMQVPVRVAIGNPVLTWQDIVVNVRRGEEVTATVMVPTPASYGTNGQVNRFPVTACLNNWFDPNPSNDCRTGQVGVAVPYFDLRFRIVGAPSSANRCSQIDWSIVITNAGNIRSMNVLAMTGVVRPQGSGNWFPNLGQNFFTTPQIEPGASWTYRVDNYNIWCNPVFIGPGFIKAEINYSAGGFDNDIVGNYAGRSFTIR